MIFFHIFVIIFFHFFTSFFLLISKVDVSLNESGEQVDKYIIEDKLGEGQHSIVRGCRVVESGINKYFAVKIIGKDRVRCIEGVLRIEQEIVIHI